MKFLKLLSPALLLAFSATATAEIAVIVNPANGNDLSDKQISRAFLGKLKSFADGQSIKAVNAKSANPTRAEFEKNVLSKSSAQVKAYWSKQLFTGKGTPPDELASDAEILSFVASTPNAIGYIDASKLDGSVKVIKKI